MKPFFLSLIIVLLDQITKYLSIDKTIQVFSLFSINYIENTGAAFGILQNKAFFLSIISIIVILLIIYYFNKSSKNEKFALSLILAGTIGNLIDRIFRGYVIDFIDFKFWPAFNIADMANVIGVLLLIYYSGIIQNLFKLKK
nr:signal peptidase II [Candidatus Woesearchaeota archaeon]